MAGRHGHKSATAVQDAPAGARHRSPDGSSTTVTVTDLVPEPRDAATPTSPPARRRWPWLVLVAVALITLGVAGFGGDPDPGPPAAPPLAIAPAAPGLAPAPVAAPAGTVTLPRLRGRDAAVVLTDLRRLGLTDVRLVTDDDRTVEDPGRWTAIGLQPRPGSTVTPDRPVVVTVSQAD